MIRIILVLTLLSISLMSCSNKEKRYYQSGELKTVANIENELYHGKLTEYYKSGSVKSIGEWENGKENGIFTFFYESGSIKSRAEWKNGVRNGTSVLYGENGNISERNIYTNGNLIYIQTFTDSGEPFDAYAIPIDISQDTIAIGESTEVIIKFGFDLSGELSIDFGKKLNGQFKVDTTLLDEKGSNEFFYLFRPEEVGENNFYYKINHDPAENDTLTANGIGKTIKIWVSARSI